MLDSFIRQNEILMTSMKDINMISELIKRLSKKDLQELQSNIISNLKYQREYWINNEKERTEHLKCLILETKKELELIIKELKEK